MTDHYQDITSEQTCSRWVDCINETYQHGNPGLAFKMCDVAIKVIPNLSDKQSIRNLKSSILKLREEQLLLDGQGLCSTCEHTIQTWAVTRLRHHNITQAELFSNVECTEAATGWVTNGHMCRNDTPIFKNVTKCKFYCQKTSGD